jgi:propanol-preferring alcohol dehydrogenase
MVLSEPNRPLRQLDIAMPEPGPDQLLIRVIACGVCRTDLHIIDGELNRPNLPLVMGHEIIGTVVKKGLKVERFSIGDRVGVPWLGYTCGKCKYCCSGKENLCDSAGFTGYTIDGGYAEYTKADQRFCFHIPDFYSDAEAAPLLCAGLIGYRSLVMAGDAEHLGIYGFGAAAHIVAQVAKYRGQKIYAFTRPGDNEGRQFALELGAEWAGDSTMQPPHLLDAAIIYAPAGELVPLSLRALAKGGTVVCAGIHMSDTPSFPYSILWGERSICSVANLTRRDGEEFLGLAPKVPVRTEVETFPLAEANEALARLKGGRIRGAAVLVID